MNLQVAKQPGSMAITSEANVSEIRRIRSYTWMKTVSVKMINVGYLPVHVDWDMFRIASNNNNIDEYADSVSEVIRKCIGDVVPTATIKTFPNQKPWIDAAFVRN